MISTNDVEHPEPVPLVEQSDAGPLSQAGRSPVLDPAQLEVLGSYGTEQVVSAGDVLFAEGDETYDLIVVLEGEVQIVANAGQRSGAIQDPGLEDDHSPISFANVPALDSSSIPPMNLSTPRRTAAEPEPHD
jgi:hypothetical protein